MLKDFSQLEAIIHSPSVWGKNTFPIILELCLFLLFLIYVTFDCVCEFFYKPPNIFNRIFLITFDTYLFLHAILILVPFPLLEFSAYFFSEELPIFLLFLCWGVHALFFGSVIKRKF